jgi:hypothetical protein
MLEKKKGNFRVDKLRAILLYEANFNQNNKKLARDMMYTVEQLKVVSTGVIILSAPCTAVPNYEWLGSCRSRPT